MLGQIWTCEPWVQWQAWSFTITSLVFMIQLRQQFSKWWKNLVSWSFRRQEMHETESLHLQPYKIRWVQVIEGGDYMWRTHYCNCFLRIVYDSSVWMGVSVLKTTGIGAVFVWDRIWKCPLHDQKIGVVCHYFIMNSVTHIFGKHNS
jgi:hypothetical protein